MMKITYVGYASRSVVSRSCCGGTRRVDSNKQNRFSLTMENGQKRTFLLNQTQEVTESEAKFLMLQNTILRQEVFKIESS